MKEVQKVQLVKGHHEIASNLIVLAMSGAVIYYSLYPTRAEQHVDYIREKLNLIHTRFMIWQGMNATLNDIWSLVETAEPRITNPVTDVTRNAERPS